MILTKKIILNNIPTQAYETYNTTTILSYLGGITLIAIYVKRMLLCICDTNILLFWIKACGQYYRYRLSCTYTSLWY